MQDPLGENIEERVNRLIQGKNVANDFGVSGLLYEVWRASIYPLTRK
ncbi:MAG: hypothetical protein WA421_04200 [Nitrososphaeraceae archaeon]|jgi:hypothetical protein